MSVERDIIRAKAAAEVIDASVQRVYELCRSDKSFPRIVIGKRQYRFSRTAIQRWLEEGGSKQEVNYEDVE